MPDASRYVNGPERPERLVGALHDRDDGPDLPDAAITAAAEAIHFWYIDAATDERSCLCLPQHPTMRYDQDRERAIRALEAAAPALRAHATTTERAPTVEQMVREFHAGTQQFEGHRAAWLWHKLLLEEVKELTDAILADDYVETADAIADVVYVAIGLAVEFGIPFDRVFAEVHRSNMTKLIPPIALREDGKIIKGPHYEPPRLADLPDGSDG